MKKGVILALLMSLPGCVLKTASSAALTEQVYEHQLADSDAHCLHAHAHSKSLNSEKIKKKKQGARFKKNKPSKPLHSTASLATSDQPGKVRLSFAYAQNTLVSYELFK